MKFVVIIMVFGAVICSFISNRLGSENGSRLSVATFGGLANICILGVMGIMFWKYMDFFTVPRILLLITVCTYIKYRKKKRFCTPFWEKLRLTLMAYAILGSIGLAMKIVKRATNGNYTSEHITAMFKMVIPIILLFIIAINIVFGKILTRRRRSSYFY